MGRMKEEETMGRWKGSSGTLGLRDLMPPTSEYVLLLLLLLLLITRVLEEFESRLVVRSPVPFLHFPVTSS